MSNDLKLVFTIAGCLVGVALMCVRTVDEGRKSRRFWRGGEHDPVRVLLARPDGTRRPGARMFLVAWGLVVVAVVWLFG